MIAATYEPIGAWVKITGKTGEKRECLVVDVPAAHDRRSIERRGIVTELSYEMALVLCGSVQQAPNDCTVVIRRIQ